MGCGVIGGSWGVMGAWNGVGRKGWVTDVLGECLGHPRSCRSIVLTIIMLLEQDCIAHTQVGR